MRTGLWISFNENFENTSLIKDLFSSSQVSLTGIGIFFKNQQRFQ